MAEHSSEKLSLQWIQNPARNSY